MEVLILLLIFNVTQTSSAYNKFKRGVGVELKFMAVLTIPVRDDDLDPCGSRSGPQPSPPFLPKRMADGDGAAVYVNGGERYVE